MAVRPQPCPWIPSTMADAISSTANASAIAKAALLEGFSVPGVGAIDPRGLLVVVGPNSSGKTLLLRELHERLTGQTRQLVVLEQVNLRKLTSLDTFLEAMKTCGFLHVAKVEGGNDQFIGTEPRLGVNQPSGSLEHHHIALLFSEFQSKSPRAREFLQHFGPMLTTALFLQNRLSWTFTVGSIDYETSKPQNEIHGLYLDGALAQDLSTEMKRAFGRAVWLDASRGNNLCFRVSDGRDIPSHADRLNPRAMRAFRQIETEGDGVRSYCAICVTLLQSRRPVCLIDEPEMCLHPPQAYAIGQFLGSHTASKNHLVVVATHSSHVLRGIVELSNDVKIIRMVKSAQGFVGRLIDRTLVRSTLRNPSICSERVLDGLFADGVLIVEADGDRTVYQAALDQIAERRGRDIVIVPVGGTGGIAQTAGFMKSLGVPVAVLADLDLLLDQPKLNQTLEGLAGAQAKAILEVCRQAAVLVRELPPRFTEHEVKASLQALHTCDMSWQRADDTRVVRELRKIANNVDRLRRLKAGGISGYTDHPSIAAALQTAVDACKGVGLFLVPVGELENWLSLPHVESDRGEKRSWAAAAAEAVRQRQPGTDAVVSFVEQAVCVLFPVSPA
jgi:hypothetical protein